MTEFICDVLVVGGSLGGTAAALAAARRGKNVVLLSSSGWVGGQITSQGVCTPDENQYVETTGSTNSYREFRQRTRQFYEANYTLTAAAKVRIHQQGHLQLGGSWVSHGFSVEPKVGHTILEGMLAELGVHFMPHTSVTAVELSGDGSRIVGVSAAATDGTPLHFTAAFFLDATDLGDLLPLARVEFNLGAEARADTGEPDAPADGPHLDWLQPITFPIALEKRDANENYTIQKPTDYEAVRDAQEFTLVDGAINGMFTGRPLPDNGMGLAFWTYRRVVDASLFEPGRGPSVGDIATINVGSNDYLEGVIPTGDPTADAVTLAAARHVSLCYIYWLQTECPRDPGDGSATGYPNLRPVTEFWDTPDGISPDPYIRESRRIQAMTTIKQQDIVTEDSEANDIQTGLRARLFPDSCGIGHYDMDIHGNKTGQEGIYLSTKPYQIPLGALVPIRVTNLLPACKNLGVTHLTNGAYRLHPIEWNTGEAAGALAAFCIDQQQTPQAVVQNTDLRRSFQSSLVGEKVPLFWWIDVEDTDSAFAAAHLLGVEGIFTGEDSLSFAANEILTAADKAALAEMVAPKVPEWPTGEAITRAVAAEVLLSLG